MGDTLTAKELYMQPNVISCGSHGRCSGSALLCLPFDISGVPFCEGLWIV